MYGAEVSLDNTVVLLRGRYGSTGALAMVHALVHPRCQGCQALGRNPVTLVANSSNHDHVRLGRLLTVKAPTMCFPNPKQDDI